MKATSLVASIVLVPAVAFAEMAPSNQTRSTNVEIGLRGGYAVPFGKIDDAPGDDLNQFVKGDVPLTIELNYRFFEQFLAGIYFSYGFGSNGDFVAQNCAGGASCSVSTLRFGIGGYFHLMPRNQFDPWLGASLGYEQFKFSASGPGGSADVTTSGVEFLNAQAGLDFHLSPLFAIGPFVSAGFGQYTHIDAPNNQSGDIGNKAIHGWFNFGARISFTP
jgi:outer membrane protein W